MDRLCRKHFVDFEPGTSRSRESHSDDCERCSSSTFVALNPFFTAENVTPKKSADIFFWRKSFVSFQLIWFDLIAKKWIVRSKFRFRRIEVLHLKKKKKKKKLKKTNHVEWCSITIFHLLFPLKWVLGFFSMPLARSENHWKRFFLSLSFFLLLSFCSWVRF